MFIGNDTLLFAVFCQLKSYPDLYAGYVPMDAYSLDLHLKNVFDLLETVLSYLN